MTAALCPGSFDPATNGHIDVIERAARHFERVVVAVVANPSKVPLFATEERTALLARAMAHHDNVEVTSFDGLLVDFAVRSGTGVIVKGLRAVSDFESELHMAEMNAALGQGLDTMFLTARPSLGFLSSSLVKEVARFGGDVGAFVPEGVAHALAHRFHAPP